MHNSHLPLRKWFLAIYLMCESKKGVSANQLNGPHPRLQEAVGLTQ